MRYTKTLRSEAFLGGILARQQGDPQKLLAVLAHRAEEEMLNAGFWDGRSTRVLLRAHAREKAIRLDQADITAFYLENAKLINALEGISRVMASFAAERWIRP